MIRQTYQNSGEWIVECDRLECTHRESIRTAHFKDAVAEAKRRGWSMRPVAGVWVHTCPDCVRGRTARAA